MSDLAPVNEMALLLEKISTPNINLSPEEIRDIISKVEQLMRESGKEIEIPTKHYFSKAVYAREISIPKGALVVGKIHKHTNLNILSKGKMTVLSIDGLVTIEAPATIVSSPGVKRLGFAHEDTVWTTIHGTDLTDVEKIEDEVIVKSYDELPQVIDIKEDIKWLGQQPPQHSEVHY